MAMFSTFYNRADEIFMDQKAAATKLFNGGSFI
jgi:hypothetical protein